MRIAITHTTTYRSSPPARSVQALRLTPRACRSQAVESWQVTVEGTGSPLQYTDAFGNAVDLVSSAGPVEAVTITATGVVETSDTAGVVGMMGEAVVPAVFLRETPLSLADDAIAAFARECDGDDRLATLHAILDGLHALVAFDTGATTSTTSAAQAFAAGRGVCQDHAHIFIAAARVLKIPARYVTGYLLTDDALAGGGEAVAHHAWAEALAPNIGWVGFDAANGQCPTDRYVRLAIGLDAVGAAPVRGMRLTPASEQLQVAVSVAELGQGQSQRQQ